MVQHIDQIVSVAVAMRDTSHRFSKLKGYRYHSCDARLSTKTQTLEDDGESGEDSRFFDPVARATAVSKRQVSTIQTVQKMLEIRQSRCLDRVVIEWLSPNRHKIVFKELGDEHPDINADDVIATNRI